MLSKNTVSIMRGAALWAATFVSVVSIATVWSAAFVAFSTADYAYPRTWGTTNLTATMWNKLIDNVVSLDSRLSQIGFSWANVGIGTSTPGFNLDVNGTVNATAFRMPTGAGTGKVLTSDANGNANWSAAGSASSFESSELAANVGTVTVSHGLGGMPKWWSASLRCKTAEMGYSVGEEVDVTTSGFYNWYHYFTSADATGVTSMVGWTFYVGNKSSGSISAITPANWRLVLRAWK